MYQVYIDKPSYFEPDMAGEFKELEKAVAFAEQEKKYDSEVTYTIEETCGTFNSYGEQLRHVVKKGFTLSEILISIGILGVIAALTLPALNGNIQQQRVYPGITKAINTLDQADSLFMRDNNVRRFYSACGPGFQEHMPFAFQYVACVQPYLSGNIYTNNVVYRDSNNDVIDDLSLENAAIQTNDGMTYLGMGSESFQNGDGPPVAHLRIFVDINGPSGPNREGRDLFCLAVNTSTGRVYAYGSDAHRADIFDTIQNANTANRKDWRRYCNRGAISVRGDGDGEAGSRYCAGSVVDNNGRVIYPW